MCEKDKETLESVLVKMGDHPFTLLGLSDREKFHTGFIAFCVNQIGESFYKTLFGLNEHSQIEASVEEKSIDLMLKCGKTVVAIAEVKLKSDLHSDQLDKYARKYPNSNKYIIGLFAPAYVYDANQWKLISFDDIGACLNSVRSSYKKTEYADLIVCWHQYVTLLARACNEYVTIGLGSVSANTVALLHELKLKGIFEQWRYASVASEMREVIDCIHFGNTHSNALLHVSAGIYEGMTCGLQWQAGSLKLYMEARVIGNKNDIERDHALRKLAANFTNVHQATRISTGYFSSVTIEKWDINADVRDKSGQFIEKYRMLQTHIAG